MLEKLLLASILTFSVSLFSDIGWSNAKKEVVQTPSHNHTVFLLTQRYKNKELDSKDRNSNQ
ncbi:MAG: hypothetical protein VKL60_18925 [Sphaerospermopsis sp.]|nr:hypothetical protein [Sphaerospermopsis sp.]